MRAHNPKLLAEVILYVLYSEAITDGNKLSHPQVHGRLPYGGITDTLLTFAFNDLKQRQYVDNSYPQNGIEQFTISRKGYDYARYRLPLAGSAIHDFSKSPDWILNNEASGDDAPVVDETVNPGLIPTNIGDVSDDLKEVVELYEELEDLESSSIPASDRTVTLDHNGEPYKEAVEALDKALEEFRKDHPQDNELGAEKGALLKTLEAGRELLKSAEIKIDVATTLLLEPLQIFAARYERELVAVVATAAFDALMKLFGLG